MSLAVDDVVEVSFRGTLYGQRILTVLHYAVVTATAGSTIDQLQTIAASLNASTGSQDPVGKMLALQSNDYTLDAIRTQVVSPQRSIYVQVANGNSGLVGDIAATPNIALSITKRGFEGGRKSIGRLQLAGVPSINISQGKWDVVGLAGALGDFVTALKNSFTPAGLAVTITPVIFNPTAPAPHYQAIWSWTVNDEVRTMHRRTLFLGE